MEKLQEEPTANYKELAADAREIAGRLEELHEKSELDQRLETLENKLLEKSIAHKRQRAATRKIAENLTRWRELDVDDGSLLSIRSLSLYIII